MMSLAWYTMWNALSPTWWTSPRHPLLHGKEDTACGDSGYIELSRREAMASMHKLRNLIAGKPTKLKWIKSKRVNAPAGHQDLPKKPGSLPAAYRRTKPAVHDAVGRVSVFY